MGFRVDARAQFIPEDDIRKVVDMEMSDWADVAGEEVEGDQAEPVDRRRNADQSGAHRRTVELAAGPHGGDDSDHQPRGQREYRGPDPHRDSGRKAAEDQLADRRSEHSVGPDGAEVALASVFHRRSRRIESRASLPDDSSLDVAEGPRGELWVSDDLRPGVQGLAPGLIDPVSRQPGEGRFPVATGRVALYANRRVSSS